MEHKNTRQTPNSKKSLTRGQRDKEEEKDSGGLHTKVKKQKKQDKQRKNEGRL